MFESTVKKYHWWRRGYTQFPNGSYKSDTGVYGGYATRWSWRSGSNNPRYKIQIKYGKQAATSFDGELVTERSPYYYVSEDFVPKDGKDHPNWWNHKVSQGIKPLSPPDPTDYTSVTSADNQAKARIVNKIRDAQTTFQGGVFLGELIESIALITNPGRALRNGVGDYISQLKKIGPRIRRLSRRRITEVVRDTWLEYQLGWAPLISEIDSAAEALANHNYMKDQHWKVVRAFGVDQHTIHDNGYQQAGNTYPYPQWRSHREYETMVRYIACVGVGSHRLTNWRRVGFAPTNWLPTIWELIPYSFVVDYFTNIGDIISAASLARSDIRWIVKTVRRKATRFYEPVEPLWLGNTPDRYSYPNVRLVRPCEATRKSVSRNPYTGSLVPSLEFNLPGCSTQWLNVAALWDARRDLRKWYR